MGGRVREYETTFIIQPEISDEGIAQLHARIDALLERRKAKRLLYDDMGRRKLAYEIRKFQKGHYWTLFYLDDGKVVPDLERMLRLEDSVLRYLTVMANEDVEDIEGRLAEAAEQERIRAQKAAERAAREAEEAATAAAEAATRESDAAATRESDAAAARESDAAAARESDADDGDGDSEADDRDDSDGDDDSGSDEED
jgi:small subunit ribosomal protein S6